jgi:hypothetical protein
LLSVDVHHHRACSFRRSSTSMRLGRPSVCSEEEERLIKGIGVDLVTRLLPNTRHWPRNTRT